MKKTTFAVLIIVLLSLTLSTFVLASGDVHWSYDGEEGPAHWGDLSHDFATCSSGREQSPIDISSSADSNPADLVFNYQDSAVNILNNGHTIQVNVDPGSTLEVDGQTYNLLQYHFHALSENTVDGSYFPMEMHLVHQRADGGLAVVGVFLTDGAENAAYAATFDNLPAAESPATAVPGATVSPANLLPGDASYWRWNGSLTTPPCSERVKWLMMKNPVELSSAQIGAFTAIYDHNYRPVQPFYDRTFLVGQQPDTTPTTGGDLGQTNPYLPLAFGFTLVAIGVTGYAVYKRETA